MWKKLSKIGCETSSRSPTCPRVADSTIAISSASPKRPAKLKLVQRLRGGQRAVAIPNGEIRAQAKTLGDELLVAELEEELVRAGAGGLDASEELGGAAFEAGGEGLAEDDLVVVALLHPGAGKQPVVGPRAGPVRTARHRPKPARSCGWPGSPTRSLTFQSTR